MECDCVCTYGTMWCKCNLRQLGAHYVEVSVESVVGGKYSHIYLVCDVYLCMRTDKEIDENSCSIWRKELNQQPRILPCHESPSTGGGACSHGAVTEGRVEVAQVNDSAENIE